MVWFIYFIVKFAGLRHLLIPKFSQKLKWRSAKSRIEKRALWDYLSACTFHDGCKQGIDQQIFNRKSISRKITHPQSW